MHFELAFVILFTVATTVAIASRRYNIPYTVALVAAGLFVGSLNVIDPPKLTKEFLFAAILPGLIFEAAFHLEYGKFRDNAKAISALAIPGVAAAIGLSAAILLLEFQALDLHADFTLVNALVFGALIAATDPIAVVALFRSIGAPKRLMVLVEGESLLNDGTAVVFFTTMLGIALGSALTVGGAVLGFIVVVGMGIVIGVIVGLIASHVTKRIDDPMIEITITVIAAYGSFSVAEHFHFSGVIATVVAGMLCGNYAAHMGMSPSTRIAVQSFWDYLAFALNSVVFLLIGFEVSIPALLGYWQPIVAAFLAVMIGRAIVVFVVSGLLRLTRERLPWSWSFVLTWAGLRGAISMVLVLGLAADFPNRELLVHMTFGVVILSIVIQGLTMNPLLRKLGVTTGRAEYLDRYEEMRGRLLSARSALKELTALVETRAVPREACEQMRADYERIIDEAESGIQDLRLGQNQLTHEETLAARRRLLLAEKDELIHIFKRGVIGQDIYDQLVAEANARLDALDDHL